MILCALQPAGYPSNWLLGRKVCQVTSYGNLLLLPSLLVSDRAVIFHMGIPCQKDLVFGTKVKVRYQGHISKKKRGPYGGISVSQIQLVFHL